MSKRAHGEGSVARWRDRWRARLMVNGQRHYVYANTQRECVQKLKALIAQGATPVSHGLTVGGLLNDWLADRSTRVRKSTHDRYEKYLRVHIIPGLGQIKADKLTPVDVSCFLADRLSSGAAKRSVAHMYAVLRNALNWAVRMGFIQTNPVLKVEAPRVPEKERSPVVLEHVQKLLDYCQKSESVYAPLIVVGIGSGCRLGELLGLQWGNVIVTTRTIRIQRTAAVGGGFSEPKTAHGRRTVILPKWAFSALAKANFYADDFWNTRLTDRVFPFTHSNVRRALIRLCELADVPTIRFHDLRHVHASLLASAGIPLTDVRDRLGHADIATTANIYTAPISTADQRAAHALDSLAEG